VSTMVEQATMKRHLMVLMVSWLTRSPHKGTRILRQKDSKGNNVDSRSEGRGSRAF